MSAHPPEISIMSSECKEIYDNIIDAADSGDMSRLERWIVPHRDFIAYRPVISAGTIDKHDTGRAHVPVHVNYGRSALEVAVYRQDIDMLAMLTEFARLSHDELMSIFHITLRHDKFVSLAFLLKTFGFPRHPRKSDGDVINFGRGYIDDQARKIAMNEYNHPGWYQARWASLANGLVPVHQGNHHTILSRDIVDQFVDRIRAAM
jgi:hypothetical protein